MAKVGKVLATIKAVITRLVFACHGIIAIWQVTMFKDNLEFWYLASPILLLIFEGVFTLTIKENQEWKWYSNTLFCPNGTTVQPADMFTSALKFFTAAQCLLTENWPRDSRVCNNEEFDFLIVGSGTAGSVVANRLSEERDWNILLLEVGGDPTMDSIVPGTLVSRRISKDFITYMTTNDYRSSQASVNGSIYWPRGRALGGSSIVNSMIYTKGLPLDYQNWYDQGNYNWHPDVAARYQKKAEILRSPELLKYPDVREYYGHNGPVPVSLNNYTYLGRKELLEEVLGAYEELGFKRVHDLNTAKLNGCGYITVNSAEGVRYSMAKTYLIPIQSRKNFKLLKNTLVTKIIIDPLTRAAVGVIAERNGKIVQYFARKEVIVCAGAINTPQLLMLSGIGPKQHLESLNIKCLVDAPAVGQNLQDHVTAQLTIFGDKPEAEHPGTNYFEAIKYLYDRSGRFSGFSDNLEVYFSLDDSNKYSELHCDLKIYAKKYTEIDVFDYKQSVLDSVFKQNFDHGLYSFRLSLTRPHSKGNLTVRSQNPRDHPIIYTNYFLDDRDLAIMAEGLMKLTKLINTTYFKSINAYVGRINIEACNKLAINTIEYFRCLALNMAKTGYHPVGSCKMGPDPKTAVVDDNLRVYGVDRLRVIDASIMPDVTTGNTNAPTIMIGERGSDLVKRSYGRAN